MTSNINDEHANLGAMATSAPSVPVQENGRFSATRNADVETDHNTHLLAELVPPRKLAIRKSKLNGYGVFAIEAIEDGEIIEEAPFIRTDYRAKDLVHSQIRQGCYPLPCNCEECKFRGRYFLITAGFVQIYNHSDKPNATIDFSRQERVARAVSKGPIEPGDEILVHYGEGYSLCDVQVQV